MKSVSVWILIGLSLLSVTRAIAEPPTNLSSAARLTDGNFPHRRDQAARAGQTALVDLFPTQQNTRQAFPGAHLMGIDIDARADVGTRRTQPQPPEISQDPLKPAVVYGSGDDDPGDYEPMD